MYETTYKSLHALHIVIIDHKETRSDKKISIKFINYSPRDESLRAV